MKADDEVGTAALGALRGRGTADERARDFVAAIGERLQLADCHLYTREEATGAYRLQHAWMSGRTAGLRASAVGPAGAAEVAGGSPQLQLFVEAGVEPFAVIATQAGPLHVVPLQVPGRIDGLLLVGDGRGGLARRTRRALLRATDVVAAVTGQLRHEAGLERELAATTARTDTSRRLHGSTVDLDQFLELLLELAIAATSSEGAFVAVAGRDGELALRAASGLSAELSSVDLSTRTGLFDWELASEAAPLLLRDAEQAASLGLRSVLALPLQQGDVALGVFALLTFSRPGAFDADSIRLLASFADQVTLMLDNQRVFAQFTDRYLTVLEGIAAAVDARRQGSTRYSQVAASVAELIAVALQLAPDDREALRRAGLVHDVGLAALPGATNQYAIDVEHPAVGAGLLQSVPVSPVLVAAVECHHEWFDGWGFPRGLRGDEIPVGGRIMGLAAFVADMVTGDPVRSGWEAGRVIEEIGARSGSQFDPAVVAVTLPLLEDHLAPL